VFPDCYLLPGPNLNSISFFYFDFFILSYYWYENVFFIYKVKVPFMRFARILIYEILQKKIMTPTYISGLRADLEI